MLRASNCEELETAVKPWVIPVNNMLTADRSGHISFKIRGRVIERPISNRWTPVVGDAANSWTGLPAVPFEQLPGFSDPPEGYIVTANNRPSDSAPYISLDFADSSRYDRISQLIEQLSNASLSDMKKIHSDVVSLRAPAIVDAVVKRVSKFTHPLGDWLLRSLSGWNCEVSDTSVEASLYLSLIHI